MDSDTPNDDPIGAEASVREHDASGQAAMLLVESLIHGLIARSVITVADAVEIVDVAAEVKAEIGGDAGDTPAAVHRSLSLLRSISDSLRFDLPDR